MTETPHDGLPPIHPGEILREDVLVPLDLSPEALATALRVPVAQITEVLDARGPITADLALRLARYLGTTADFWVRLQATYDLKRTQATHGKKIARDMKPREAAQ
jgi:antitoxin HigA-1